jgi:hypothetical protein
MTYRTGTQTSTPSVASSRRATTRIPTSQSVVGLSFDFVYGFPVPAGTLTAVRVVHREASALSIRPRRASHNAATESILP